MTEQSSTTRHQDNTSRMRREIREDYRDPEARQELRRTKERLAAKYGTADDERDET